MEYTEDSAKRRILRSGGTIRGRTIDTTSKKAKVGTGTLGAIDFLTNSELAKQKGFTPYFWKRPVIEEEVLP